MSCLLLNTSYEAAVHNAFGDPPDVVSAAAYIAATLAVRDFLQWRSMKPREPDPH